MEDKRLEETLSQVKVVSVATKKTDRKASRMMRRPKKNKVANKKITSIGNLEKGEKVKLAKRKR